VFLSNLAQIVTIKMNAKLADLRNITSFTLFCARTKNPLSVHKFCWQNFNRNCSMQKEGTHDLNFAFTDLMVMSELVTK
jgi:hypothetical protein